MRVIQQFAIDSSVECRVFSIYEEEYGVFSSYTFRLPFSLPLTLPLSKASSTSRNTILRQSAQESVAMPGY
jgi:hypothetical protein